MNQLPQVSGSPVWQLAFISFAIILVVFEILRGWRRGVARQLARLGALISAYFAAYFGGQFVVPLMRPFLQLPDMVMSILAGAILALFVYAAINGLGTLLFRRTSQHESAFARFVCGISGAVIGLFFGAFLVWILVVGARSVGAVAEAQARQQGSTGAIHAVDLRNGTLNDINEDAAPLMTSLARLKNSLEMGAIGDVVKKSDVVPSQTYETLGKISQIVADPAKAERFLTFPGANELEAHPRIVALRDDPDISRMIEEGRFLDLLQNQKILDALNDPTLLTQLKQFDLQRALDYAAGGK